MWRDGTIDVVLVPEELLVDPEGGGVGGLAACAIVEDVVTAAESDSDDGDGLDDDGGGNDDGGGGNDGGIGEVSQRAARAARDGDRGGNNPPPARPAKSRPASALAARMTVYVGVNRVASRATWAAHIAEALVHETFETYWSMPHSVAVVAELLVSERSVPTRIMRQIEAASDQDLYAMEQSSDPLVLDVLCFVPEIEERWDTVSEAARRVFVALLETAFPSPNADVVSESALQRAAGLSKSEYREASETLINLSRRWGPRHGSNSSSRAASSSGGNKRALPPVPEIPFGPRAVLLQLSALLTVRIKHAARSALTARNVSHTEERNPFDVIMGVLSGAGVGSGRGGGSRRAKQSTVPSASSSSAGNSDDDDGNGDDGGEDDDDSVGQYFGPRRFGTRMVDSLAEFLSGDARFLSPSLFARMAHALDTWAFLIFLAITGSNDYQREVAHARAIAGQGQGCFAQFFSRRGARRTGSSDTTDQRRGGGRAGQWAGGSGAVHGSRGGGGGAAPPDTTAGYADEHRSSSSHRDPATWAPWAADGGGAGLVFAAFHWSFLLWAHLFIKWVILGLYGWLLAIADPKAHAVVRRVRLGVNRQVFLATSRRGSGRAGSAAVVVTRIVRHDPDGPSTTYITRSELPFAVLESNGVAPPAPGSLSVGTHVELHKFGGVFGRIAPKGSKRPLLCVTRFDSWDERARDGRMAWTRYFAGDGATVKRTVFYVYKGPVDPAWSAAAPRNAVPHERIVLAGLHKTLAGAPEAQILERQHYDRETGLVVSGTVYRTHTTPDGASKRHAIRVSYSHQEARHPLERDFSTVRYDGVPVNSGAATATILVQLHRDTRRPARVIYRGAPNARVLVTLYQYKHLNHPAVTTREVVQTRVPVGGASGTAAEWDAAGGWDALDETAEAGSGSNVGCVMRPHESVSIVAEDTLRLIGGAGATDVLPPPSLWQEGVTGVGAAQIIVLRERVRRSWVPWLLRGWLAMTKHTGKAFRRSSGSSGSNSTTGGGGGDGQHGSAASVATGTGAAAAHSSSNASTTKLAHMPDSAAEVIALGERYPTRLARTAIWTAWGMGLVHGVYAKVLDESILRREPLLRGYWRARDLGQVDKARGIVIARETAVTPTIGVLGNDQSRSHLIIRTPDLIMNAGGGECHMVETGTADPDAGVVLLEDAATRRVESGYSAAAPLEVTGLDSGTWPSDGGGVATCRRDLVDQLPRVRWDQIAELGNPMKVIRAAYQTERNVRSLTFIHLWGTELGGPNETILSEIPYGSLSANAWRTTRTAIRTYFIPLMRQLVWVCNVLERDMTPGTTEGIVQLFVNLHVYFQNFDWTNTWNSADVIAAWREAWLVETSEIGRRERIIAAEVPNVDEIDFLRGLFVHFLLPLGTPYRPTTTVVHSSHHGIQSLIGVVASRISRASLVIWDHGILWRERIVAVAELDTYSLFVRNSLICLTRVCVRASFAEARVIVPCASVANPPWEARLGGGGTSEGGRMFPRLISPVLNGMDTGRFSVRHAAERAEGPTAVMLSHVNPLKDILNAIRAAHVIVHRYKVAGYRLLVYGNIEQDAAYAEKCRAEITNLGLDQMLDVGGAAARGGASPTTGGGHVMLMGPGDAPTVLGQGWIFVNSSMSEGLPLAIGEAGLAGLPCVATDVGGSSLLVSDPVSGQRFGTVVPARSPEQLARAQVEVLAMIGPMDPDESGLTVADFAPIKPGGASLEDRMFQMIAARRHLGLKFRVYLLRDFSLQRYLREHEQVLWIAAAFHRRRKAMAEAAHQSAEIEGIAPPIDVSEFLTVSHIALAEGDAGQRDSAAAAYSAAMIGSARGGAGGSGGGWYGQQAKPRSAFPVWETGSAGLGSSIHSTTGSQVTAATSRASRRGRLLRDSRSALASPSSPRLGRTGRRRSSISTLIMRNAATAGSQPSLPDTIHESTQSMR
jgi:glycosyltransferase involved in cell wall biosynthesis